MFKFARIIAAIGCACVLSGCYTSGTQLITADKAEYLFGSEMQYVSGETRGQLRRDGNDYLKTEGNGDPTRIRFHRIETSNFFVVEEGLNSPGLFGPWNYDLMEVVSGDTMLLHNRRCDSSLDAAFLQSGALTPQINQNDPNGSLECGVDSL